MLRKIVKGGVPFGAPKPESNDAKAKVKKAAVAQVEEEEGDEEESPRVSSLAAAFDSVDINSSASDIMSGKYEAIITRMTLQAPDAKGQSVRVNFELCSPKYANKNQLVTWFKLLEKDHITPIDGGIKAFKAMLARLGYKLRGADMEDPNADIYQDITREKPGVMLKVSYQEGSDGVTYQRITVDSKLEENDIVEAYKDNVPY